MDKNKLKAWKNVKNAGIASLVIGWIYVGFAIICLMLAIYTLNISNSDPIYYPPGFITAKMISTWLLIGTPILITYAILQIIAGNKLKKPIANPKKWLITLIVLGALSFNLMGIITLVFSIIAISSYKDIEGQQPPSNL